MDEFIETDRPMIKNLLILHNLVRYRIVQKTDVSGDVRYFVEATSSRISAFLGGFEVRFSRANPTLAMAEEQIIFLKEKRLKSSKMVGQF